jgi:cytoskeletal protein RodZ
MNMEEQDDEFDVEEGTAGQAKMWLQENLRVIVSVFIVAAIALGIYSYSDRTAPKTDEQLLSEVTSSDSTAKEDTSATTDTTTTDQKAAEKTTPAPETVTPTETSRETDGAFVESAVKGEGLTHLARKAAMNYLEKNPNSALTAEHKVYIEDYLRKKVSHTGGVKAGTSVEFSKSLIDEAIAKSKTLSAGQLNHLKQYSARVAAYRN